MILPSFPLVSDADEHSTVHSKNCGKMTRWSEDLLFDGPQHQEACYNDLNRKMQRSSVNLLVYLLN